MSQLLSQDNIFVLGQQILHFLKSAYFMTCRWLPQHFLSESTHHQLKFQLPKDLWWYLLGFFFLVCPIAFSSFPAIFRGFWQSSAIEKARAAQVLHVSYKDIIFSRGAQAIFRPCNFTRSYTLKTMTMVTTAAMLWSGTVVGTTIIRRRTPQWTNKTSWSEGIFF